MTDDLYRRVETCTDMPKVRGGRLRRTRARRAPRGAAVAEIESKKPDLLETKVDSSVYTSAGLASKLVEQFRKVCCDHVTIHPECKKYAPRIEQYMRNQFTFFGLKSPALRTLEKQVLESNKMALQDRTALVGVFSLLWEQEEREFQHFGCTLFQQYRQLLMGATDEEFHEAMETVKHCICTKSWWDTVDMLASHTVGYLVQEKPSLGVPLMEQWINDDNMWLRRTALLHQLSCKDKTDVQRLFSFSLKRAHETEFFIRKAIGWSLRQYAWTDKKAVKEFVEKNKNHFSSLSVREALKNC